VFGLANYAKGRVDPQFMSKAIPLFEESKSIKKRLGDVEGVAESENAIAIALIQEGLQLAKQGNVADARTQLQKANAVARAGLDRRMRTGSFWGASQLCRNVAWPVAQLMRLSTNDRTRKECFSKAKHYYKQAIELCWLIAPRRPVQAILNYKAIRSGFFAEYAQCVTARAEKRKWASEAVTAVDAVLGDFVLVGQLEKDATARKNLGNALDQAEVVFRQFSDRSQIRKTMAVKRKLAAI
jgi:hypothetical protein